jgi:hypothetical protein
VQASRGEARDLSKRKSRRSPARSNPRRYYYLFVGVAAAVVVGYLLFSVAPHGQGGAAARSSATTTQTTVSGASTEKPIILYVNQGNGVVNGSNFDQLLQTATSHGFNTIFFQVYRSGTLLFTSDSLDQFVVSAHDQGLEIFFAVYFTNATQTIPTSIYSDGEDGISLDMSTLPISTQTALFDDLSSGYSGKTAITTTDPSLPLAPDLLVVETYAASDQQYIHPGIIAGVEVVATSSRQDYEAQVQYALDNSDGVMVFDYAGLVKSGY